MVKHTQTIRWQLPMNCLGVFDHFVKLKLKELTKDSPYQVFPIKSVLKVSALETFSMSSATIYKSII